jgi:hypothetical protein
VATINDPNYTGTASGTLVISKANPSAITWPTATSITYGQTLASSTLSGGSSIPAGTFAFTTPTTAPPVGTNSQSVIFTPTDTTDYNSVVGSTNVTVTAPQCTASYQRTIVIDHTKVPNTDQVNFPFLFNTTDLAFKTIANGGHIYSSNGNDIVFSTDPNGSTKLDYELETYNPVTGQIIAWIRIPTLSYTVDTPIYMFYGNSSITTPQQNPTGVWNSNYLGVWHLPNGTTLTANDSTSNGHNGTLGSSSTATAGQIGGGANVNTPATGAISIPAYNSVTFPAATFSAWVDMSQLNGWAGIIYGRDGSGPIGMDINGAGNLAYTWNSGSGSTWGWDSGLGIPTGSWAYTVISIASSGTTAYVCQSGSCSSSYQSLTENPQTSTANWYLGSDQESPGGRYWGGSIDEARISDIARSADWIATEYNNQNSPLTFYSLASESLDGTPRVTPPAVSLYASQSQPFAMLGMGTCSPATIHWAINPAVGTMNVDGLYSTSATISAQQNVTVTGTNPTNNTSANATVTLMPSFSGPVGTVITINGAGGFGSVEGPSSVTVGGLPAMTLSWSNTQIQAQIPIGIGLGIQSVVVTVGGQTITNATFNVTSGITGITPPVAGVLASLTIDTAGQQASLIFNGGAEQLAFVQLTNSTFPGCWNCYDETVSILKPDGSVLTSNSGLTSVLVGPDTLPVTGPYSVQVTPTAGGTGSANLSLWTFQNLQGTTASGTPTTVTINTPGQNDQLTFNGTPGQRAFVQLSNSTFPGCWNCDDETVSILKPDGSVLTSNSGLTSVLVGPDTLPVEGPYSVQVIPTAGGIGSADVTVWLFYDLTGTITSGTSVPVNINIPGQQQFLSFTGTMGQVASLQLTNSEFTGCWDCYDETVSILKPDGSVLTSNSGLTSDPVGPVTLPSTGTYTVQITPTGGGTGSATALLTLSYPNVTMSASLAPAESWLSYPVAVSVSLTAKSGAAPTGTVSCSGAGVTSALVTVNPAGKATVPMNGLPIGKDAIVCSFTSSNLAVFSNAVSSTMIETVTATPSTGSVSVTPASATIYGGQTQQFTASVFNTSNQAVNWTVGPSGAGTISASGLYTAPASVSTGQTFAITATSQADTTQSAAAMITLSPPQCASSGYSYQRSIVIDHTKVPNTDQVDFPFLFNSSDPTFATTANRGHVTNPGGDDIIFSTDPAGLTKLDHELEQYDPVSGQITAWVRIPTLSHSADTVLYLFYGNPSVKTSQQNPTGVWDSNYTGVYHLANLGPVTAPDSTANGNNGTLTSMLAVAGEIDAESGGAAVFNGVSSFMQIPSATFASYPTSGSTTTGFSASFGAWFKTASAGVILGQDDGTTPGNSATGQVPALYIDAAGSLRASLFSHNGASSQIVTSTAYNDNNWHFVTDTYTDGTEELYVDGQLAGSQQVAEYGYNSTYAYFVGTGDTASWPASNSSWLYFNGALAEVNVSNIARSGDWVQTAYSNQSSPAAFYALHPENAEEIVPSTVSLYASQSQQFTVLGSIAGSCGAPSALWSMPSGLPGTLTAGGLYTAPSSITSQQSVTISATTLGDSTQSLSATATLMPPVTVSVTPSNSTLTAGQTQQLIATVNNTSNAAVTWTTNPAGAGLINSAGLYTAPADVATQQTINITATSQADPTQSAAATITLSPTTVTPIPPSSQCGSSGYSSQRTIIIDHAKVPNTDQTDFPFFFNTTDAALATIGIGTGGQVVSSSGNDIIFSTDPNGLTKLDYELEQYNPATGQMTAWVRIPTLSHTTDTILYMFYGNPNISASQQNPSGVWNSNYTGVYHLTNTATGTAIDSTTFGNNGTLTSVSSDPGPFGLLDEPIKLNGNSSFMEVPNADFPNFPTGTYDALGVTPTSEEAPFAATFGLWFKTAFKGTLLDQANPCTLGWGCETTQPGVDIWGGPYGYKEMLWVDDNGSIEGGGVTSAQAYNDNNWHNAVVTYANSGTWSLYVDGQNQGSTQDQFPAGYSSSYLYFIGVGWAGLTPQANWDWFYFNGDVDEVSISDIPRSSDWIQTEYNNQSSPATFYVFNPASTAQVVPSAISLYALQSQQLAVSSSCNSNVLWTMPSGSLGTLSSAGLYTAPEGISASQNITITAQANGATIGSAVVTLLKPPSPIALSAAALPPYAAGSSEEFTATLKDQYGNPEIGVAVTFNVSGANNNLGNSITDSNGVASFSYTGANSGNDSIQATAVVSGQLLTSNSVSASWIVSAPQNPEGSVALIAPPTLGQGGLVGAFTDVNGNVIEPIAIGASAREYVVPAGATQLTQLQLGVNDNHYADNGGSGFTVTVNGQSVLVPPTAMPWNWVTGGQNNNYQYAMNDGTGQVVAAKDLTPGSIVSIAYQSGTASANYPVLPSVNADGDQTFKTGVQIWQGAAFPTLYTSTSSYPVGQPIQFAALVTDGSGKPMPNVPVDLNVQGANPQTLTATTDSTGTATFIYSGAYAGIDSLLAQAFPSGAASIESGQASITWATFGPPPTAGSLTLSLYAVVNNEQAYAVLAEDANQHPEFNANVGFYITGADTFSTGAITDNTGHAAAMYYHANDGNYNVAAVTTIDRNVIFATSIPGVWPPPQNCPSGSSNTMTISISAQGSVTLGDTLALNGSVTDCDGLTPTSAWTYSGPGTVTFGDASKPITTATFSDLGTYQLTLGGSDASGVTGSSQPFTVQVVPAPQDPQGWIISPAYGSTISGTVPIILSSNVALQPSSPISLTYYPANNPNNSTSLPITGIRTRSAL